MCLVDKGEGLIGDATRRVEFHQVLLALKDGEVTATGDSPGIHIALVEVVHQRVFRTEHVVDHSFSGAAAYSGTAGLLTLSPMTGRRC